MTEWARLVRAFKRAVLAHQLAAHPTIGSAARSLGMDPSNFRKTLKRQRHQPPTRETPAGGGASYGRLNT